MASWNDYKNKVNDILELESTRFILIIKHIAIRLHFLLKNIIKV